MVYDDDDDDDDDVNQKPAFKQRWDKTEYNLSVQPHLYSSELTPHPMSLHHLNTSTG